MLYTILQEESSSNVVVVVVREGAYRGRSANVLGEQDTLRLDDKEVGQLVDISKDSIEGVARNCVVAARTKLAGDARVHDQLAGNLGRDDNSQGHPGSLESVAQHIEVPNREDGRDHREVGDGRGTCICVRFVSLVPCPDL